MGGCIGCGSPRSDSIRYADAWSDRESAGGSETSPGEALGWIITAARGDWIFLCRDLRAGSTRRVEEDGRLEIEYVQGMCLVECSVLWGPGSNDVEEGEWPYQWWDETCRG